ALAGQLEKTVALLQEGTEAHPHAAALHNNLAVALMALGRYEDAQHAVQRGLQEDPGLAPLHRNLGDLQLAQGDRSAAMEAYAHAVRHHETLGPEVWARLGALRAEAGDADAAKLAFEQALVLDPQHVVARAQLQALGAG